MFRLIELPYSTDALSPHMSKDTLELHHGKHHAGYVTNLNKILVAENISGSLEELIVKYRGDQSKSALFNNAGQTWNHDLFWKCMRPNGGGEPRGALSKMINHSFGDYEKFRTAFQEKSTTHFGSGWVWLVQGEDGKLQIVTTMNADNPVGTVKNILLGLDVWEHAYYLDYQNRRVEYVNSFLDKLIHWDFVESNLH